MELNPGPPSCKQHAVLLRHGHKKYGDVCVLKNLSMSVRSGTVYGLLGASGCGKTTLLSCVVGLQDLDTGVVLVLGDKPGEPGSRIGYMPQEIGLYPHFTIRDTMRYFGWIFKMKAEEVEEKSRFLLHLLDIPNADTMNKNLSGGQKRRVSFAVALLHDPELLVLDEPTVGMDPLLREVIWKYLMRLSSEAHKTIVFTTHYIEEANQAHTIGLMRNGRLLDEGCPDSLLQKYNCANLEDAFLHLSLLQESGADAQDSISQREATEENITELTIADHNDNAFEDDHQYEDCKEKNSKAPRGLISKGNMRALIFKNLTVSCRDMSYLAFTFGLLLIAVTSVYVGLASLPRDLRLAVVNHDSTSAQRDCAGRQPLDQYSCNLTDLSCRFLAQIGGPTMTKEFYNSTETAVEAARRGEAWGTLYFSPAFTEALIARVINDTRATDEQLSSSNIYVRLDMSNYVSGLLLRQEILAAYDRFSEGLLSACNYSVKLGKSPMRVYEPLYGSYPLNFINFAAPGTLIVMMFFFGVALTTWCVTVERLEGLVNRNRVAGVTTFEVLLSYMLSQSLLMCGQAALLIILGLFVYKFQCVGSMALAAGIIVVQGINGILLGLVISSSCDRMVTTNFLAVGSLVPMLLFCGIIWPVEGMDAPLQIISSLSPLTMPVKALRAVMARGWTIYHFEVYTGIAMTFLWMFLLTALCVLIFRFKRL